jgi:hypothetical protein
MVAGQHSTCKVRYSPGKTHNCLTQTGPGWCRFLQLSPLPRLGCFLVSSRQHGAEAWPGTPQTRMLKAPSVTLGTTGRFDFNS